MGQSTKVYATTSTNTETELTILASSTSSSSSITTKTVDKYTNTDDDLFEMMATGKKSEQTQTVQLEAKSYKTTTTTSTTMKTSSGKQVSVSVGTETDRKSVEKCGQLVPICNAKYGKFNLDRMLRIYLQNEFKKKDLSFVREKFYQLLMSLESSNSSLQLDNRRLNFGRLNNGFIKCLNRNMLIASSNSLKVSALPFLSV